MLWRARNEIYARRGLIFSSEQGKELVVSLGGAYHGADSDQERVFKRMSPIEQDNVRLLKAMESGSVPSH
jgi:hypothetical protein